MLKFAGDFRLPPDKSGRIRVLGDTWDGCLLFSVTSTTFTSVEMVDKDQVATTVISFPKFIDLVNADLSNDRRLVHLTERLKTSEGYVYISVIHDIQTLAKSKDFRHNQPMMGIFHPVTIGESYQLIHIVGQRVTHLAVTVSNRHVDIEKVRGGINIPNVIYWNLDRDKEIFSAIFQKAPKIAYLAEYKFNGNSTPSQPPYQILYFPNSALPLELALHPSSHLQLPFYRNFANRFFIHRYKNTTCLIQQLFDSKQGNLSFSISTYPHIFNRVVTVPQVQADLPICSDVFNSIVIVFVPNEFMIVIDISSKPPVLSFLPKQFATSFCSSCAASLPIKHHLVDLDLSEVVKYNIDFSATQMFSAVMDKTSWEAIAHICSKILDAESIAAIFNLIQEKNEPTLATKFISDLFTFTMECLPENNSRTPKRTRSEMFNRPSSLSKLATEKSRVSSLHVDKKMLPPGLSEILDEIETEFPSASRISRRQTFKNFVKKLMKDREMKHSHESAADEALEHLRHQNEVVLVLRDAIDLWVQKYSPSQFWQLSICFVIKNETCFNNFPRIPCLNEEIQQMANGMCSPAMTNQLTLFGVLNAESYKTRAIHQAQNNYWSSRFTFDESESSSSSSSMWISKQSFSRQSNMSQVSESLSSFNCWSNQSIPIPISA